MLKQRLQQKLLQKLSPQQIQMIKLLEIPTMQLHQRIKKELEENPALEEGAEYDSDQADEGINEEKELEEFSLEDYLADQDDTPAYKLRANNYSKDDERKEIPFSMGSTFHESLLTQLGLRVLSDFEKKLAEYIIGNIDDDGYLRRDLDAIVDDLAFALNMETSLEQLKKVLEVIQDFDPPGVGATNLQECLLIQIRKRDQENESLILAEKILDEFFTEFTRKHYDKIIAKLNITEEELKAALDEILRLNPKPGGTYSDPRDQSNRPIIPDFILDNQDGNLEVSLYERNVPDLKVSRTYAEMLDSLARKKAKRNRQDKETITFVRQKLDSARWFIDAIRQRQTTLLITMEAILEYQHEYFLDGDEKKLKPMILKDIADITGLDISTISRVANSKYIQTDFGILSLKSFFSEAMQTTSGEEVSAREVKSILEEAISGEDKKKPLTDERLTKILQEKGYQIARRTVAKYREQLDIPVARLRKEL
ncbi:MAG: RNA polymerase sigma-54 factor [Bacteroidetes bacterium HGW-Bacteroidetes-4]|jgi:RNA polymerase sigma-54 factor|nr:MAG: RNA polymerase sigma-54 factor [Bacteroidetes bacterium HGW-Bacteroidetes-4]